MKKSGSSTDKWFEGESTRGLDGLPWIKDGSVEVTLRIDGGLNVERRELLKSAGLVIKGSDASASILVGRIAIDRLFVLAEVTFVRRVVPTSGG